MKLPPQFFGEQDVQTILSTAQALTFRAKELAVAKQAREADPFARFDPEAGLFRDDHPKT
jgi:hypothetical protein